MVPEPRLISWSSPEPKTIRRPFSISSPTSIVPLLSITPRPLFSRLMPAYVEIKASFLFSIKSPQSPCPSSTSPPLKTIPHPAVILPSLISLSLPVSKLILKFLSFRSLSLPTSRRVPFNLISNTSSPAPRFNFCLTTDSSKGLFSRNLSSPSPSTT